MHYEKIILKFTSFRNSRFYGQSFSLKTLRIQSSQNAEMHKMKSPPQHTMTFRLLEISATQMALQDMTLTLTCSKGKQSELFQMGTAAICKQHTYLAGFGGQLEAPRELVLRFVSAAIKLLASGFLGTHSFSGFNKHEEYSFK